MPDKGNTRDGFICPQGCKTNYHSTYPRKMTLPARAGMFFKYPGLTGFCLIFSPLILIGRVLQKVNQDKCLMLIINNTSMVRSAMVSSASKNVYKNPLLVPTLKDLLKDCAWKLNPLVMQNSL